MAIGPLDVLNAIAGLGGHDHALIKPLAGDRHAGHQEAAGVAAQIQHIALDALGLQILHRRSHIPGRIGIELFQADIAQALAIGAGFHLVLHRVELNALAHQGRGDQGAFAAQLNGHLGAGFAADQLDRLFGGHALGGFAIDRDDDVLR